MGKDTEKTPLLLKSLDKQRSQTSLSSHSSDSSIDESTVKLTNYGIFYYTQGVDLLLLITGTVAAVIHGAGFPLLAIVLGGMTTVFLRAQNSDFVVGVDNVNPEGLVPISLDEFNSEVVKYCIYYLVLGVLMFFTSYVQIACFESYAERLVHKLRQNYLKAILRQQIQWFDKQQTGNLTARLTDDLERVREGLGDKFALLVQMFAAFLAGYGVGFFYSWSMTLVMMGFAPLIVLSGAKMSKSMATRTRVEQETYAVAGAIAEETFSSIRTVHSLNGHKRELDRFYNALEVGRQTGIVKYCYMGIGVGFSNLCMYSSYALAFWYGSTLIINDPTFDRGLIFTVFFAVLSGSTSLGGALPHLASFGTARGAASTVLRVINSHPKIDPYSLEGILVDNMKGDISFKDVHFRYPSRKDIHVLKGISLELKAGDKIALVGSSGCGKSTIVNLLQRFYDPTKGRVLIDGVDLREVNVHSLREQIGIVSQEPVLFDGTIYENIKMGNEHATHDQVVEACKMANANDFIKRLPDGYGTRVGEKGVQLSGGQKQRIAIARALVKNPKILLLDEATSALDTEAEREVQGALDQAQAGRTTIIVAHRLSTIRNVDRIFVFKAGNIVESGSHEELMSKQGIFYDMTQAQVVRQQQQEAGKDIEDTISESAHSHLSRKSSTRSAISIATSIHQLAEEVEECKAPPTSMFKIFKFNGDKVGWFIGGIFGAFIFGSVTPVFALVYAEIFNVYSLPADQMQANVYFWCGMFVLMGITFFVGFFTSANCLGRCGESLTMKLRFEAFKNLLRQDIAFYDDLRHGTGKLCTRFATDAPNVRYVFTRLPVVLASIVTICGALGIGFYYGWQLALILVVMVPLLVMGGYFEMQMRFGKQIRDTQLLEEAGKVASQAVEHIRTVHSLNRQEQFHFTYCEYLREPFNTNLKHAHTYGAVFAFSQSLIFFMYAAAFYLGSIFVNQQAMQPIDVYRVFFAISFCGQMIGNTTSFIPDVVKARLAASLLFYLIEHPTPIDSLSDSGIVKPITGNISIRNVFFNYPTRKDTKVLQGFTLDIKAGKTVALVGHSGCGKSTIMGLLERFYNQDKGMIMIDGDNIRNLNISSLREQVCIVSQEPTLFDCTIGENICYGTNRNVTYQEIVEAAKMANIHNFILGLPDGYDTHVGEKGTQLSGGQKQRIAIARALVRSPSVLLLDEATSALDTESEKIVQEALDAAKQGRTCLVIAHRLSTIQNSDVIAIVSEGKIVEKGTHDELIRKSEIYQKFCETQRIVESQ
ncbi:ABC-type xenobiotic transporter [Caenorhabditis elegans]|uniref:ABC-type xenobiotic transporter n=1 Tax=Caenorhabditis elegans TaxID=6239 RepID=G5EDF9_CAEEL|nr:P-GlycoProtein related [Caenorhabditis elegans]ABM92304.1 ABC transporter PGP-2 [Caenorhabditis elegans]CCD66689.1 P-GlycoProtein related [Caenorhabditis elegans]|eukprot:NP_491707.2 P-GlycoProtein related [Caenorhabditis elegans]